MSGTEEFTPVAETAVEHQFDELDVDDAPAVGIVMGSKSDMTVMEKAGDELEERGIRFEIRVMSAHRDPDTVADYAKNARMRGLRVIIAGAGLSAALPGVVAAHTDLPVIGVPLTSKTSVAGGLDALLSDHPDAPGRTRSLRGSGQREERRRAGGAHPRRVIERYTRPEMGAVWSEQRKLDTWLQVELAVVDALAEQGLVPEEDAAQVRERAAFTVEAVHEREQVTDHDVAAFVDVVAQSVGEAGRWVHHGLTSSDVLDTALGLQLSQAGLILVAGARDYRDALVRRAREHAATLCVGRTHGVHAEPTTFGVKLAGFAFEAQRNLVRLERAVEGVSVGALSGAVGTYSANGPEIERLVLTRLGLGREDVSTQVVPRDRHAELLEAIALAGAGLERFATEIRHLQRTEVREVEEPFRAGAQKGSSAMPHKRNPILCERIVGIARLLRGYAVAGLEDVALWHERDISHSSVERVALPDATILLDYAQHLAVRVVDGMIVHEDRMRANLEATHGALFSQRALLALVESGVLARRGLPDRPGERPARLGHRHPLPRAARRGGAGARPGRGVRRPGVRAPRADDRRPPGRDRGLGQPRFVGHGAARSAPVPSPPWRWRWGFWACSASASRCRPPASPWRTSTRRSSGSGGPPSPRCRPRCSWRSGASGRPIARPRLGSGSSRSASCSASRCCPRSRCAR